MMQAPSSGSESPAAPRVSVVMSCYNTCAYLPAAIDSVLHQTFSDFEFIIINDGSTDGSREYLDSLTDPRIKVVHQENQGLGIPINQHMKICRGEYIVRTDSDDYCFPERIEKQVELLDSSPETVMIGSQMRYFNEVSEGATTSLPTRHEDILNGLLKGLHTMSHPTMMFRRSLLDKIEGYRWHGVGEDWGLQLDAAKHGKLGMVSETLYKMRLHTRSTAWRGAEKVFLGFDFAIERYRQWEKGEPETTFDEYMDRWNNAGWLRKFSIRLRALSSTIHRQSRVDALNGKKILSLFRLAQAAAIYPPKTVGAIWKKLKQK